MRRAWARQTGPSSQSALPQVLSSLSRIQATFAGRSWASTPLRSLSQAGGGDGGGVSKGSGGGYEGDEERTFRFVGPVLRHQVKMVFSRSSGAGGQHVNTTETKVDMRLCLKNVDWLPKWVIGKLREDEASNISSSGDLRVSSQAFRSQEQNVRDALRKLGKIIAKASIPPVETSAEQKRKVERLVKKEKARRREDKQRMSSKKTNRKVTRDDY